MLVHIVSDDLINRKEGHLAACSRFVKSHMHLIDGVDAVDDDDIAKFFEDAQVGKVRDVRLITDKYTGKSKG